MHSKYFDRVNLMFIISIRIEVGQARRDTPNLLTVTYMNDHDRLYSGRV